MNSSRIFVIILAMVGCYVAAYFMLTSVISDRRPAYTNVVYKIDGATYNLPVYPADSILLKNTPAAAKPGLEIEGGVFNRNPVFLVWMQLILIMVSLALGAGLVFWWQAKHITEEYKLNSGHVFTALGLSLFLCIILGVIPSLSDKLYLPDKVIEKFKILFSNPNVPPIVVGVTLLFVLPVMSVIFLLVPASDKIARHNNTREQIENSTQQLQSLNKILTSALQTLAVVVVFSVLTSGTLRETIRATIYIPDFDVFPKQESYVYGIYFSSFLAIIYVPVYMLLKQLANGLRDDLARLVKGAPATDDKWVKEIDGVINDKNSAFDTLKLTFTVLSPLITSFLPELLKLK